MAASFAEAMVSWRHLHKIAEDSLWPRVLIRLKRAYTLQIPPLKVGSLDAVRTVTELILDELGWLVRNLVLIDRADPDPRDGDTYLQFAELWAQQGRTRALYALETLSADALDCCDLAVRLSTEFDTAYESAALASRLPPPEAVPPVVAARDFTWLRVRGTTHKFKKGQQAEVMRALYEAWTLSGGTDGAGLSQETLAEKAGASRGTDFRIRKLFEGNSALGTILRPAGKGQWALWLSARVSGGGRGQQNPG